LPSRHDQIIGFLNMRAPNVPLLDASLPLVRDPRCPCLQIRHQLVQLRLVLGRAALRFQHRECAYSVASPQATVEPAQQLRFGQLASADPAAELQAFLLLNILKLPVSIRMSRSGKALEIGFQGVVHLHQQAPNRGMAHQMVRLCQLGAQPPQTAALPLLIADRVASGFVFKQYF